jgi:polysaccharide chain length determinant protein (PEP-CTERM system associated)
MTQVTENDEQVLDDIQLGKYLDILNRRKWWVILPATAIFVIALIIAMRLPNFYHAETTIMVDPQKVPDTYVPSTGNTTIADRLSTIRQEVMSPTVLQGLLEQTGLYAKERQNGDTDRIIRRMQRSIQLDVVDAGGSRLSTFKIGYTGPTPEEAALIPNKLAKMVMDRNIQARQEQSSGTADFLENELQDTKKQLEQKEAEMGRIKSTYIMDLPESKQFHLEALTSLRNQLQSSQDRVSRDQQEKVYLQSMMASTNPTVDLDADSTGGGGSSPEEAQLQKAESRLAELRGRYGPGHPDVRKAQNEIDQLKAKIAQTEKSTPAPIEAPRATHKTVHNPVIEAQINKLDQEIQEQTKAQKPMEEQMAFHSSKLEREPIFEQQIAGLMRDYDTLRGHYNRLLDKKLSADMYTSLVSREEGEKFEVLDHANVPSVPFGPNRFVLCLTGLLAGLVAGTAAAVVKEMTDPTVRNEHEAANILGKSVMAGIPIISTRHQERIGQARLTGALAATIVSAAAVGYFLAYVMERLA